jgi:hypothetical protein
MRLDRSFFELQAIFAKRVAEVTGMARVEAYRRYTTFYWVAGDNDAGMPSDRWSFDPRHPRWIAFIEAVDAGADPAEYVHRHHLETVDADRQESCFEYDYWPDFRWVRLHFGNSPDGLALRAESRADREGELRRIFTDVAREHPDAAAVRCCSWLYHVPAYDALFPPGLVTRMQSAGFLHQFTALWGQFLDGLGNVKGAVAEPFVARIGSATSLEELETAFPLDVLAATCPIDVFHRHFGV